MARICRSRSIRCWARPSPLRTARKVAARGQAVVVLPVLWTGLSEHHMSFGGTITLDFAAFSALVEGVVRSVLRHGFRRIVLLNAHGGNENALRTHHRRSDAETWRADRAVHLLVRRRGGDREDPGNARRAAACVRGGDLDDDGGAAGTGGDDRIPLAKSNHTDVGDMAGGGVYRWRTIGSRSGRGVIGNPEAATREKGERLFDAISTAVRTNCAMRICGSCPGIRRDGMSIELTVNGTTVSVAVADDTPLLDVLRNHLDLKGSRYGCGLEQCGSCMVLIDGEPDYACAREVGTVAGKRIEHDRGSLGGSHPLQQAFLEEQAGQCGYCLSGII